MKYKVKRYLCILLTTLLFIIMPMNRYYHIQSLADDAVSMNPLYIPITALVTATAVGSGIIANGTQDAINGANQLVQNVISNIKSSEIQKREADASYKSPFEVINGDGDPEQPNNDNKNGKWVALGAGALASNEIWTNKEAVKSIMSEINKLNGYNKTINQGGIKNVSDTNILSTASASGIAQQLANYDSRLNTQFTKFLNSDVYNTWLSDNEYSKSDMIYSVTFAPKHLVGKSAGYPLINIYCCNASQFSKVSLNYNLGFNTLSGEETNSQYAYNYSFYYLASRLGYASDSTWTYGIFRILNDDNAIKPQQMASFYVGAHNADTEPTIKKYSSSKTEIFKGFNYNKTTDKELAYVGYKWANENPWQFTNNVYNVNQTFDVNFPDWLQQSITLLGQQLEGLRLGLTTIQPSWNPTQEQIQTGLSPTNVINQYINNYENPEYIPEDNPNTGGNDEPISEPDEEYKPDTTFLGEFMLPSVITSKFPFCIPFDIARAMELFSTQSREAPKWELDLRYGTQTSHIVIDLAIFDDLASFIRPLEYILFLVGLAVGTRSLIRG